MNNDKLATTYDNTLKGGEAGGILENFDPNKNESIICSRSYWKNISSESGLRLSAVIDEYKKLSPDLKQDQKLVL